MPNKSHHSSRATFRRPAQGDREINAPGQQNDGSQPSGTAVQLPTLGTNLDSRSPVPSTSGTPSAGISMDPCHEAVYVADSDSESEGEPMKLHVPPSAPKTSFPLAAKQDPFMSLAFASSDACHEAVYDADSDSESEGEPMKLHVPPSAPKTSFPLAAKQDPFMSLAFASSDANQPAGPIQLSEAGRVPWNGRARRLPPLSAKQRFQAELARKRLLSRSPPPPTRREIEVVLPLPPPSDEEESEAEDEGQSKP